MNRQPSAAKYKIGNPQLVSSTRPLGNDGPYPSLTQPSPKGDSSEHANGSSPARPARSRLRDGQAPDPARPPRLQTSNLLAATQHDLSPVVRSPDSGFAFSDPFAADKAQRSELRQQTSDAHQASTAMQNTPSQGADKLRNVVGAFMAARRDDGLKRPQRSEARPRAPKKEESWDIEPTGGDIDVVLQKIKKEWPFVLESDFSPSTLALSLLARAPSTSLPAHPPLASFNRLHENLSLALQSAVQSHFQTFAASLPQHATFLTTLGRAQDQVKLSKQELNDARDGFAGKGRGELAGIRARERQVRDMLRILDTIDHLKSVPDRLEGLIGDKKFIEAAVLLVRSVKTSSKPEIAEIAAMSELNAYFASQTLADILGEELHSHVYLKTFYSDSRWAVYKPGQTQLMRDNRFSLYIQSLATKPNHDPTDYLEHHMAAPPATGMGQAASMASLASMADEPNIANPEIDSFSCIENVLEALAILGRLGSAVERMSLRVTAEVRTVMDATLDEVEERIEQRRSEAQDAPRLTALEMGASPQHAAVLRDLFWTLYSKLAAVLEAHRIVYEVARWISSRRDVTFTVPVLEIYKPIQAAVRALLRSYLSDDSRASLDSRPLMSLNEVIREGKIARDRQKSLFKFGDTDTRALSNDVKPMDDLLQAVLKVSVPGLQAEQTLADEGDDASHRTLVPPNVFNVTTLFEPTIAFIERAGEVIPPGFENEVAGFGTVLEDFVVGVFLPQLDERVTASFQQAVSGYDAHQVDRKLAGTIAKPPLKSSVRVMNLIHSLCNMLLTTPFHRENYSRLIIGVIVQYYQQCSARFKDLASAGDQLSLPAAWSQREDVIALAVEVQAIVPSDIHELYLISMREIRCEMDLLKDRPVLETDLIGSPRRLEALAQLAESLRWFIDSLLDLEISADEPITVAGPKLPLTQAMSLRFDAIIQTYEQLTEMVLNTIRLEVRGRVICNLGATMRGGDFCLESEAVELDPDIVDLVASLKQSEELATESLGDEDRVFVGRGLSYLAEHLFISSARHIKAINLAGVAKMKRNVLSVQQCLRGFAQSQNDVLARAMMYWDLYEAGPKQMLEDLKTRKPLFTFDEYNTMLNLQCKTSISEPPSSELNTYLIDLHALSMSIDGWEIGET